MEFFRQIFGEAWLGDLLDGRWNFIVWRGVEWSFTDLNLGFGINGAKGNMEIWALGVEVDVNRGELIKLYER